jgi:hypothetical protein
VRTSTRPAPTSLGANPEKAVHKASRALAIGKLLCTRDPALLLPARAAYILAYTATRFTR